MAAKIPTDVDKSDAPLVNTESLGKGSSDRSISQDDTSKITKRNAGRPYTDRWLKLNFRPVCFGTRDTQYGDFSVSYGGKIAGFTLVHLSGYVTCGKRRVSHYSFWGCGDAGGVKNHVNVVITTSSNHVIVPPSEFFTFGNGKWSEIPGYNSMSPEIVLPSFSPFSVRSDDQFRLWYGDDLVNFTEHDNGGRVCADVYALYA
ncbi:hypothetical protein ACROYT_G034452 [Oculina patagonica]